MTRTRVVIQSRLNSSRLPGKALLTIAGMPLIELVARRASRSGHDVVVATSAEEYDGLIASTLDDAGIAVIRGPLDDVLGRFLLATEDLDDDDLVVRLTGDNPVADADLVDELITTMSETGHAYGRVDVDAAPEGIGAEVFPAALLRAAATHASSTFDREHVTPWIRRNASELLFVPTGSPTDIHAYRCTVDTLHDFVRVARLFADVPDPVDIPWRSLMDRLGTHFVTPLGARVPLRGDGLAARSGVILSGQQFADNPEGLPAAEHRESLRALIADAVDRGVTHVEVGTEPGTAELFKASSEPAVTGRLGVMVRLSAEVAAGSDEVALRGATAEALRRLGRASVDTVVLPVATTAQVWSRAASLVDAGLTKRLGVTVDSASGLRAAASLPSVHFVLVQPGQWIDDPAVTDDLDQLATNGIELATPEGQPLPVPHSTIISAAGVPAWAAAVERLGTEQVPPSM